MTEPMTMNRLIHAAVRRDLSRLSAGLDQLSDGDRARAQELDRAFTNLQRELTRHHEGEDSYVWPMLAADGVDPTLLATMENEHHAMAASLTDSAAAMSALARSGGAGDAAAARESVGRTRAVVEQHLAHEESELEPVLVPRFDSAEWKTVEKKLSRQSPGVAGPFFAWLTDGMTDDDRAFLKTQVPMPVVSVLGAVFGRRYNREIKPTWRDAS